MFSAYFQVISGSFFATAQKALDKVGGFFRQIWNVCFRKHCLFQCFGAVPWTLMMQHHEKTLYFAVFAALS